MVWASIGGGCGALQKSLSTPVCLVEIENFGSLMTDAVEKFYESQLQHDSLKASRANCEFAGG